MTSLDTRQLKSSRCGSVGFAQRRFLDASEDISKTLHRPNRRRPRTRQRARRGDRVLLRYELLQPGQRRGSKETVDEVRTTSPLDPWGPQAERIVHPPQLLRREYNSDTATRRLEDKRERDVSRGTGRTRTAALEELVDSMERNSCHPR